MYEFARGPLVWIAFIIFFAGSGYQLYRISQLAKKDKVVYPYYNLRFSIRSIVHWLIPFGTTNMRMHPFFTAVSFGFHFSLLVTPLLALGHIELIRESWGISWWNLPDGATNALTLLVIMFGCVFALRRVVDPTVRFVSNLWDFALLLLVLSPFITGMFAYYQVFDYKTMITLHMFCGAGWLIAIPFTKLIHMIYFGFTRAYMGSEFGYVRNSRDW